MLFPNRFILDTYFIPRTNISSLLHFFNAVPIISPASFATRLELMSSFTKLLDKHNSPAAALPKRFISNLYIFFFHLYKALSALNQRCISNVPVLCPWLGRCYYFLFKDEKAKIRNFSESRRFFCRSSVIIAFHWRSYWLERSRTRMLGKNRSEA